ncbi:MAG: tetraacyldisaccharide 4'-kinase, partial [Deltaproteobacteria bacterium]
YTAKELKQNKTMHSLTFLRGKKVCAFSGIGNPNNFKTTLEALGANVVSFISFADHHRYNIDDVEQIKSEAKRHQSEIIVTTEKDSVKLNYNNFIEEIFTLVIDISFGDDESKLQDIIFSTTNR